MLMTKSDCSTYFLSFIRCKEIKCFAYVNWLHLCEKNPATRNNQQIKKLRFESARCLCEHIMMTQSFTNLYRAHCLSIWRFRLKMFFFSVHVSRSMALGVLKVNSNMWWFTCLFISFMFRCGCQHYFQVRFCERCMPESTDWSCSAFQWFSRSRWEWLLYSWTLYDSLQLMYSLVQNWHISMEHCCAVVTNTESNLAARTPKKKHFVCVTNCVFG